MDLQRLVLLVCQTLVYVARTLQPPLLASVLPVA